MDQHEKRRRKRGADAGFSIVEIAVTITLISIVIVPLLLATATLIKASSVAGTSSELDRAVQDVADRITRSDAGCSYQPALDAAANSRDWPVTSFVARYQYFQPGDDATEVGTWSAAGSDSIAACGPTGVRTPRLIQLVTVTVTGPAGNSQTIQVVKSDV